MDVETGAMASLIPKLHEILKEEYKLQPRTREDVEYLCQGMDGMHGLLLKVANMPREQLDVQVKMWAEEVKELSDKMELVVDELLVRPLKSEGFLEKMGNLFKQGKSSSQQFTDAIKLIKAEFQDKEAIRDRYKLDYHVASGASAITSIDPRIFALYKDPRDLIGIDGKTHELMELLSDGNNMVNEKLKIVSVVGSEGLGKTTLVNIVYDKIKMGFDCNAFVIAGPNADLKMVLKHIILEITRSDHVDTTFHKGQLVGKIREILESKRYLIVIDDIWDENLWRNIDDAFPNKNNHGSRIITTTRIVSVSKACCSSAIGLIYQMKPLSDVDSKTLFYKRVFNHGSSCPREFEQVSEEILKECGGLPLVIITIASILSRGPRLHEFHSLLKSIGQGIIEDRVLEEMQRILSYSYYNLPRHLKTCLLNLSMSTFPGSHTVERDSLVKKWIAEGIVTQKTMSIGLSKNSLVKVACQYLDELVNRNVIQPLEFNNNHEVITYHINPMMHYVLKTIASEENYAASRDDKVTSRPHRVNLDGHLTIDCMDSENIFDLSDMTFDSGVRSLTISGHANRFLLGHFKLVRDLVLQGCKSIDRADLEHICTMVQLRRLCLAEAQITELPPQLGNLQALERLDVGGTRISELPKQIGKLKNLKELDVGGTQITHLPTEIGNLICLEILNVRKTQITELPAQIGNLACLERLDVGGTQITQLPPQISKLQRLKNLDARRSRVKDLPDTVVQLTRLVDLLIGDSESCEGVKLPEGIGKMTSLQQLCTIDLGKCSASSVKELGELPCLKEISVVAGDEPKDMTMNSALLSSLDKSTKLRSLVVYGDFRLSTLQSSSQYEYLECRKKVTVVRRSLKVPIDTTRLRLVHTLDIRVCKLEEDDLKILRELPGLKSLIVRLEVLPRITVRITSEGFAELESFYVDCRMPRVIFEKGAMTKLGHLELKLYAGSASEEHMDIKHLLNLQKVSLWYCRWYATNKGVRETTDAVKTEAKEHQNNITLCISEENKDGTCNMKTEFFPENNEATSSRMTYIEEGHADGSGDDTQARDLQQSSFAIASCSGTKEIEEVVE